LDQSLEKSFLNHILKNKEAALLANDRGVESDFFVWSTAGKLFQITVWYSQNYDSPLTNTELERLLKASTTIPEDLQASILTLFTELQTFPLESNFNFLLDQIFQYHKTNLVENALRSSVEVLSEKKVDKSIAILKDRITKIENKFRTEIIRSGTLDSDADKLIFEYNDRKINPDKYKGIHLGFNSIDYVTGGLKPGTVTLCVGPWKSYKSALALNIAYNVAKDGKFVYYFANEGTRELFHSRMAAKVLGIPLSHITDNRMTPQEEVDYLNFYNDLKNGKSTILNNIYFDEVPLSISTPDFLASKIKKLKEEEGKDVCFVIIDHFGRMSPSTKDPMQDWQKKGLVAQQLCGLALENRLVLFMLAHPNVASVKEAKEEGKDINPEDLGLSSQPLKDVDYMFSWVLENIEEFKRNGNKGFGRLALKLSRHSMDALSTLNVDGSLMRISEVTIGGTGGQQP
jgi:replicative DNA helicase